MLSAKSLILFCSCFLFIFRADLVGQVEWTASDQNSVFELGSPGEWDSAYIYAGVLLKVGDEYRLWYAGSSSSDFFTAAAIGCATSEDLIHWTRCGGEDSWCDKNPGLNNAPSGCLLIRDDDPEDLEPYKAWYKVGSTASSGTVNFSTSADGCHWIPYGGNPVLVPTAGSWDSGSVAAHSVIFDKAKGPKGTYRMWYTGQGDDCTSSRIGYAESEDGFQWTKSSSNPVLGPDATQASDVFGPRVLHDVDTGIFEMWYNFRCIEAHNYATSLDGITWTKYPGNPLQVQGASSRVPTGPIVWDGQLYHMIYTGGGGTYFGYATSTRTLPMASFTMTPESGTGPSPLTLVADASRSSPAQSITQYSWDFGDGTTAGDGVQVEHGYQKPGEYLLMLTVTDLAGAVGQVARKISVSFPSCPKEPWRSEDIGAVSSPGRACFDDQCVNVLCAVGSASGKADAIHFIHQEVFGDFSLTCHILDPDPISIGPGVAIMARESTDPESKEVSIVLRKTSVLNAAEVSLFQRDESGDRTTITKHEAKRWLRLVRQGELFLAFLSSDGTDWKEIDRTDPAKFALPPSVEMGFAAWETIRNQTIWHICDFEQEPAALSFRRGDANTDGAMDLSDAVFTLSALFLGGDQPSCAKAADVNDDGAIDISDPVFTLARLFTGGDPIPDPGPLTCGPDPTVDGLGCASGDSCP
jgi:PKD domain-containing protein